jgi:hypothetical protein
MEALGVAGAAAGAFKVGRPKGLELREGEILPPEAEPTPTQGLPRPPPTIEGEINSNYVQNIGTGKSNIPTAEQLSNVISEIRDRDRKHLGLSEVTYKRLEQLNREIDRGSDEAITEKNALLSKIPQDLPDLDLPDEGQLRQLRTEYESLDRQEGETAEEHADGMSRVLKRYISDFTSNDPFARAVFRKAFDVAQSQGINTQELGNQGIDRFLSELSPSDQEFMRVEFAKFTQPKIEAASAKAAGPTDMSRRSFLQGAAALAASTAVPKVAGKALAKSRLVDPQTPYAIARQTLYGLHENVGQAADHLLDLAGDAFKEHGADSLVGRVNTLASELIRSGQVTSSGINVEAMANAIRQQISTTRPFLEAGERPPPGVSDAVDEIEAQHTELASKATDEVIAARDKTALAERSPEKLEEFTQALPKGSTRIAVDAFTKVPPEKFDWIPNLSQRLASGATSISVPTNTYIARIEKEIHDEIKEFVSHGEDLSPTEVKELKENKLPSQGGDTLQTIRDGAGFNPRMEIIPPAKPGEFDQVPWTAAEGNPWGMSDEDYAVWRTQPENAEAVAQWEKDNKTIEGDKAPPPIEPPSPEGGEPTPSSPKRIFSKAKAFGRTEREYTAYEKLIAQRDVEDVEWRLRRAQAQAERENSKAWKDEASAIRSEVRDEISSRPEIAAYRFFQDGVAFGNKLARRPKINEQSLTEAQRASFPKQFIAPRGRGYDPDAVANLFGFSDGDTLIAAVSALEREATAGRGDIVDRLVDAEVNRRVDAKLGETAKEKLDEAYDHALSATQLEMIHERMLQLGTQVGTSISIPPMATKLGALNLLHQELFGGISSRRFLNDAGRFGRRVEKALLEGDPMEAFKSAQAQYIATEMAKEARQVEKEKNVFDRLEKRYRQREVSGRDPEYTNWVHDILYKIGEGKRNPADIKTEIDASAHSTFQSFLDSKAAMGREIYVAEHLLGPAFGKNLEDMRVLEARQTFATLRSLDKVSRDENRFEIEGQKRDRKALLDEMVEKLESLGPATVVERQSGRWDKVRSAGRTYLAYTLQMESLLNRWDRGNAFGVFNQWIGRPLIEAANSESVLQRQIAKAYRDLPNQLTRGELNKSVPNTLFRDPGDAWQSEGKYDFSNAEPIPFTRKHLRAVMLNAGNPSNLKKLADGYQIKPEQVLDWLNTYATKKDWDWAQAHGDMFKTLKDMSDTMYRNLSGVAPESIEVSGIQTPHGDYRGWYHPLIYDPIWRGERMAPAKPKDLFEPEYFRANTPASYTKARTGYVAPLDLSLDQVPSRLTQEIHDISFHEPVVQASKLLYDSRFLNAVTKYYGKTFSDMFVPWLKDIANAKNYTGANQAAAAQWITWFRSNMIGTFVGLNPGTIEKHTTTALANSINEVGGVAFRDAAASLFNDNGRGETNWAFAMRTFDELQRRHQNFMETVSGAQETALGEAGLRETMLQFGTKPVAFFDLLSAVPTALAAYKTTLDEGRSLGDAVYAGNRAVRRAHGSTAITSRSAIQREYPSVAILYNFMSRMGQYQFEHAWQARDMLTGQAEGKKAEYSKNIMIGLFTSVFFVGLVDTLVSDVDEKDTWESIAGKSLATGVAAPWIGAREVMHAITHKSDPMLGAGSSELKLVTDAFRDVGRKDLGLSKDRLGKTVKHFNNAIGLATGLTNAEVGNLAEYIIDLNSGKAKPRDAGDWWRGLRRGRIDKSTSEENVLKLIEGGKR